LSETWASVSPNDTYLSIHEQVGNSEDRGGIGPVGIRKFLEWARQVDLARELRDLHILGVVASQ